MAEDRDYDFLADHARLVELRNNPRPPETPRPVFSRREKALLGGIWVAGMALLASGFFL
jgi:hypothetical protein